LIVLGLADNTPFISAPPGSMDVLVILLSAHRQVMRKMRHLWRERFSPFRASLSTFEQPIDAHVKPVRNLADAIEIQGAQPREMNVESTPAADADTSADGRSSHECGRLRRGARGKLKSLLACAVICGQPAWVASAMGGSSS
jgi:hypothetical protein